MAPSPSTCARRFASTITGSLLLTVLGACSDGRSISTHSVWGSHSLSSESKGEVRFTEDESDVASLSPKSSFKITEERDGVEREYRVQADADGVLTRIYRVDGQERSTDQAIETWRAEALQRLFRNGYDTIAHAQRLFARGGAELVLEEVNLTDSDFGKAALLRALLEDAKLDEAGLVRSLRAAGGLDSDFERARTLRDAVARFPLAEEAASAWLQSAAGIDSDFELARTLEDAAEHADASASFCVQLVATARTKLESDFELARLLDSLLPRAQDRSVASACLEAMASVDSDFERGKLLTEFAPFVASDSVLHERYRALARELGDFERGRALAALDDATPR